MTKIIRICDYCKKEYSYEEGQGSFHKDGTISFKRGGISPKRVCCYECGKKLKRKKVDATCIEKFGVINPFSSKNIQEKIKETNIERYGVDNPAKCKAIQEKIKETNIKRYGCIAPLQNEKIRDKVNKTNIERYGVENVFQSNIIKERIKQTNIEQYGTDNPAKVYEIQNKIKTTNIKRYGFACPVKNKEVQNKGILTKKKNNSFKRSKTEDRVYELLKEKFSIVERQYVSEKYPFACDFYIPELDLYIEFQGFWHHGWKNNVIFGSFNNTDLSHLKLVEEWTTKINTNKSYKIAINVWTIRDPLKRKTAKENNLNWLEFWTVKEVEDWLKTV